MGSKNPKPPIPIARRGPHLIQQCFGPPHAPPQTAAPTVEALSHTYAVKSPLVTMARPKFAPKSTLSRRPIPKCHYLIPGLVRLMMPNGIQIRSAVFPQCTGQTDAQTDSSSRESLVTIGRRRATPLIMPLHYFLWNLAFAVCKWTAIGIVKLSPRKL